MHFRMNNRCKNNMDFCKVLVVFAGPCSNPDNAQHHINAQGMTAEAFDILDGSRCDLADDTVWDPLLTRLLPANFAP